MSRNSNVCCLFIIFTSGSYAGGWTAQYHDNRQFLQIDLGDIAIVTGIATQGNDVNLWWLKKYKLFYGNEDGNFTEYSQAS